jgi:hypothetical protein
MPFATHVLNISYSMVAEEGACCLLSRGGGGSTVVAAAADHPPLLAPGSWGWGDMVVLQVVAGLFLPYCTPPGYPGGEGE